MNSILTIVTAMFILAGCTLGPDYVRPDAPMALDYRADAPWKEATPLDHLEKGAWWAIYGDAELDRLEQQAAAANQELHQAAARLAQVRSRLRSSEADRVPRIDLNGSARRQRTSGDLSFGLDGETSNLLQLPFDLSYEIDLFGRVRRSIEAAEADTASAEADYQAVLLSLQAELARSYFGLRALDSEIALLQKTVGLREDALKLVQSQFRNGVISQLDLSRAETELATVRSELLALQRQRDAQQNAIAVLVGDPASKFQLATAPLDLPVPAVAPGLPSSLLERRPDIAAAERQMAAASARIGVAETAFFPAISLTGSAGFTSTEVDRLFDWDNRTWGLGPAISLPIFEGGRNRANLERSKAAYEEAVAAYRQQVLVAFAEVEDGLSGLAWLQQQDGALQQAVAAANQAWHLSEKRYRAGRVSYLEVVDTQRTALETERAAVQLKGARLATSVLLIKALGGGWQDGTTDPATASID